MKRQSVYSRTQQNYAVLIQNYIITSLSAIMRWVSSAKPISISIPLLEELMSYTQN